MASKKGGLLNEKPSKAERKYGKARPKRRRDRLRPLGTLLRSAHPVPVQVDAMRIFAWWSRAMPPRIVARARPVRLDAGILIVHTVASTWAQELSFMTNDILRSMREADLGVEIRSLRFRTGPMPPLLERRRGPGRPPEMVEALTELPSDVGRALARVHDDDLRKRIHDAACASLARTLKS